MAQNTAPNSAPKFFNRDLVLFNSSLWGGPNGDTLIIAADGTVRASLTVVNLTTTGNTVLGNATSDTLVVTGNSTFTGTATGNMVDVVATTTTTGKGLDVTGNTALTSGILVAVASSATAITGAGRLLSVAHSGATSTSGIIAEVSSAATDETVIMKVTASAALAAGVALQVSGASVTTGTLISAADANALTTGAIAKLYSNSSDATARVLVDIKNDHASAVGAVPLKVVNDAPTSTNYFKVGVFNTVTLWMGNGTDPNGVLSGTAGDVLFNGASNKPAYCTGTTTWVNLV